MPDIDPKWHKEQVERYSQEWPVYKEYAEFMHKVLLEICKEHAPLALVDRRAKTVPSFAEKAVRKYPRIQDPVNDFDDLCGARVVALTQEEVNKVSEIIEQEFLVNDARSGDKRLELASTQFGYLARHYVVELPSKRRIYGILVPKGIGRRRAEIQVKTLLQHAWASVSHDSLYKNDFQPPEEWHRRMARLAAILEEADQGFNTFLKDQAALAGEYSVYMSVEKIEQEIAILRVMLKSVDKAQRIGIALRLASMLKAQGEWQKIVNLLRAYKKDLTVLREMGYAQVRLAQANDELAEARNGAEVLTSVIEQKSGDHQAHYYLAQAYDMLNEPKLARQHYAEAYQLNANNPYYLMAYVERNLAVGAALNMTLLKPVLKQALQTCGEHSALGIELPGSLFTRGKLAYLLEDIYGGQSAYLEALLRCPDAAPEQLPCQLRSFDNLEQALTPQSVKCLGMLLTLALAVKGDRDQKPEAGLLCKPEIFKKYDNALIIAGSCHSSFDEQMAMYRPHLREALKDFEGVVVCGGTVSGIAGVVGEVASELAKNKLKRFHLIGYLPLEAHLPENATPSKYYDTLIYTKGEGFSPLESLQTWLDLTSAGIKPDRVRVMGFGGGSITGLEYRLALALGSQVGVVADSGRAVDELLQADHWKDSPDLLPLPTDAMTFKAFTTFLKEPTPFSESELDQAARAAHENYLKQQEDQSSFDKLEARLKDSNKQQIMWSLEILDAAGFDVVLVGSDKVELIKFSDAEKQRMGEMEHGRWNFEKLKKGYRPAEVKDESLKLHDCIIPWESLTKKIQGYDVNAVKAWPEILAAAGLEIRRRS